MTNTAKTILFFVGATIFNVLLMVVLLILFIIVPMLFLGPNTSPQVMQVLQVVGLIASVVLTFLIYGWAMKWLTKRFDLEKNLPQIFRRRRP